MINLLPSEEKEILNREEYWKMIILLGIFILIFFVCLSLTLFSIKTFTAGETEVQKILFSQKEKEFKFSQSQILQEQINIYNEKLLKLETFYQEQSNFTGILEKIYETLPIETHLTSLVITPSPSSQLEEKQGMTYRLSGFSPTREKLLEFKKNLEEEKNFSKIIFPLSSWVEPVDINFAVKFNVK
jgi:Tfp pilus assembly protein PilN